ncbi:MAG TPA: hypothetical protein VFS66_05165 [Acidimicrobiia bacterium]|nr:hypothetical protein [Acidimicrobiia bacterium]
MIRYRFPWILWGLSVVVVVLAAFLIITAGPDPGTAPESAPVRWVTLLTGLAMVTAGTVILVRLPKNPIGWLATVMGFLTALQQLAIGYAASCAPLGSCNLPFLITVDALWFPSITIGLGALFLLFPEGTVPRGWRRALFVVLVSAGLFGAAVTPLLEDIYHLDGVANPWAVPGSETLGDLPGVIVMLSSLTAVVDFVVRARKATGLVRLQMRWLSLAGVLVFIGAVLGILGSEFGFDTDWAFALAVATIPVAMSLAIVRYRLYEIDRIVSRTISYSIVVGLLAGVVATVAAVVGTRFDSPPVVAATTLAVAAAFNPLRRRVQNIVDRRFNRSRYDAERVMDEFAASLQNDIDTKSLVDGWIGVVEQTTQPSSVGVWVKQAPS